MTLFFAFIIGLSTPAFTKAPVTVENPLVTLCIEDRKWPQNQGGDVLYFWQDDQWVAKFAKKEGTTYKSDFKKITQVAAFPNGKSFLVVGNHRTLHGGEPAIFRVDGDQISTFMGYLGDPKPRFDFGEKAPHIRRTFKNILSANTAKKILAVGAGDSKSDAALAKHRDFYFSPSGKQVLLVTAKMTYLLDIENQAMHLLNIHSFGRVIGTNYHFNGPSDPVMPGASGYSETFFLPTLQKHPLDGRLILDARFKAQALSWQSRERETLLDFPRIPKSKDLWGKKVKARKLKKVSYSHFYDHYIKVDRHLLDLSGQPKLAIGKSQYLVRVTPDKAYVIHNKEKSMAVYDLEKEVLVAKLNIPKPFSSYYFEALGDNFVAPQHMASPDDDIVFEVNFYTIDGTILKPVATRHGKRIHLGIWEDQWLAAGKDHLSAFNALGESTVLRPIPAIKHVKLYCFYNGEKLGSYSRNEDFELSP